MRDAKDMRIDGKRRRAESDGEYDARRLPTDAGKRFEFLARFGHPARMRFDQGTRGGNDVLRFRSKKAARLNQPLDIGNARSR